MLRIVKLEQHIEVEQHIVEEVVHIVIKVVHNIAIVELRIAIVELHKLEQEHILEVANTQELELVNMQREHLQSHQELEAYTTPSFLRIT